MKRFLYSLLRSSRLHSLLVTLDFTPLVTAPAFTQGTGNSPWEDGICVLQQAFSSIIARGLSLVATL